MAISARIIIFDKPAIYWIVSMSLLLRDIWFHGQISKNWCLAWTGRGLVQNNSANRLISLLVLISFIFTVSCTTTKVHPIHATLPQEKVQGIKVGDTVKVATYSGEQYKFKVENITNEAIEGDGIKIALTEIESIKKVNITGKAVAIVVTIIAVVVALILFGPKSDLQGDNRNVATSDK